MRKYFIIIVVSMFLVASLLGCSGKTTTVQTTTSTKVALTTTTTVAKTTTTSEKAPVTTLAPTTTTNVVPNTTTSQVNNPPTTVKCKSVRFLDPVFPPGTIVIQDQQIMQNGNLIEYMIQTSSGQKFFVQMMASSWATSPGNSPVQIAGFEPFYLMVTPAFYGDETEEEKDVALVASDTLEKAIIAAW